jgi:hypothetical protein
VIVKFNTAFSKDAKSLLLLRSCLPQFQVATLLYVRAKLTSTTFVVAYCSCEVAMLLSSGAKLTSTIVKLPDVV